MKRCIELLCGEYSQAESPSDAAHKPMDRSDFKAQINVDAQKIIEALIGRRHCNAV